MIRICAWCKKLQGVNFTSLEVTHGICPACKAEITDVTQGLIHARVISLKERPLIWSGRAITYYLRLSAKVLQMRRHYLNPVHIMCRLRDNGFSKEWAAKIAKILTKEVF